MRLILFLAIVTAFVLSPQSAEAQLFGKKKEKKEAPKKDDKKKKDKIKPYSEVVPKEAISDEGLFHVHKVDEKYLFEIPFSLLDQEILVVSRISGFVKGLNFGGAGVKSRPQQVVRWQRKDDNILLRSVSFNSVADFDEPIYESVKNNNFEPVIQVFDIQAFNEDSTAFVIEIDILFESDIEMIGPLSQSQRKNFSIKGLDKKRSFVNYIKSFPQNVEVRHVLTYNGSNLPDNRLTGTLSVEMNQSFILLPEKPMMPRYYDERVGYFSVNQVNYSSNDQRASRQRYITRWRLEPKDKDAYARGELVEPIKPIVYYIDPATPEKWRPYIKQGVDDWQSAFEKAGFKNAIMAKDPPSKEEDPDWSPEDVRYSVIRYVSTDIQNAMGPHVHDPRTGEILESDIIWYHNVMNLLRNWFFVQTAAINPDARGVNFDDEVMGRLIRFVSAHEVGHTLGLPHNMGSSVAYPVDSLRSPSFTQRMGTAPSIMDYARFNYVAQPEDGDVGLMPNIGPYDEWSIIYGYKLITDATSAETERKILNTWVKERANNPLYRYGRQQFRVVDPSAQTEDLGDDAIKASDLGIKNLKRIVPNLLTWTAEEGESFTQLEELYSQVHNQFRRYIGHVANNVGGVLAFYKTYDQNEPVLSHVAREKQQRAVEFINRHVFDTPGWLVDKDILNRTDGPGIMQRVERLQSYALNLLMNKDRVDRMLENELLNGDAAYKVSSMFDTVERHIFRDLEAPNIDAYRRQLQRNYVEKLISIIHSSNDETANSELSAYARTSLINVRSAIDRASPGVHVNDLKYRVEKALKVE